MFDLLAEGKEAGDKEYGHLADNFGRLAYRNIFELVFCMIRCGVRAGKLVLSVLDIILEKCEGVRDVCVSGRRSRRRS